jgi:TRAP-type C4-dicarboxylate transport system permease small subunit
MLCEWSRVGLQRRFAIAVDPPGRRPWGPSPAAHAASRKRGGTPMSRGIDLPDAPLEPPLRRGGALGALERIVAAVNQVTLFFGMSALVVASLVLTYSVFSRYLFKSATDWQDEVAVFCIVGAVFLCGAWVQAQRGHVGIEAVASILSQRINRVRVVVVDMLTLAFCAFFSWKSWTLFHEAWVDKMTTSSTFSPPLTIPYGLMAAGMTLLVVQLLLQVAAHFVPRDSR